MKKTFLLSISIFIAFVVMAQQPVSYEDVKGVLPQLTQYEVPEFNMEKIEQEDAVRLEETGIENIGRVVYRSLNMKNCGVWTTFDDGSKLWRFQYHSKGAEGTCVYFDNYHVPEGGEVFLYSADKSYFIGPIGSEENNEHGKFVTDIVPGETAILEYYQPADVVGNVSLDILGFGHFYKGIYESNLSDFDKLSDPCEVDVNCPEGDGWENQRDAVVRLRMTDGNLIFYCSGTMVNNTSQDCRQYLLTALHCVNNLSAENLLLLKVHFNYERAGCGEGDTITSHNLTGVLLRANSNDNGGVNGSDFALLEVEDEINPDWNIYLAGWDAGSGGTTGGVGIHHPDGDIKKISTFTSSLSTISTPNAIGAYWEVVWAPTVTNHGVTEGGSSGSALFNTDKQIVGTLTSGASTCETPYESDLYGKMSYHWTGNPNTDDQKLKVWLDPENSGAMTLDGISLNDCLAVDVDEIVYEDIAIYPNPTDGYLSFNFSNKKIEKVQVFNSLGKLVLEKFFENNSGGLDLSALPDGVYYLTFTSDKKYQLTKKITKL